MLAALALAGCGGQSAPSAHALQQEASSLQSLAAEGSLLASDAARGRSTSTFVRIHAAELSKAADASASVFAKGRAPAARALASLGARVGADLDRLSHAGSNHALEGRLASELTRSAEATRALGKRL